MQRIYMEWARNAACAGGGGNTTLTFPTAQAAGLQIGVGGVDGFHLFCNNTHADIAFVNYPAAGQVQIVNNNAGAQPCTVVACHMEAEVPPNPATPPEFLFSETTFAASIVNGANILPTLLHATASWVGGSVVVPHIRHIHGNYDRTLITGLTRSLTPPTLASVSVDAVVPGANGTLVMAWKNFHSIQGPNVPTGTGSGISALITAATAVIPWSGGPAGMRTVNVPWGGAGAAWEPDVVWLTGECESLTHYVDQTSIAGNSVDVYTNAGADSEVTLYGMRVHSALRP